jgi:hypothetical protein
VSGRLVLARREELSSECVASECEEDSACVATSGGRLLAEGTPIKVVSELLGHSDVTTTLRIYAHVIEGAREQATSAMDRLFRT